MEKLEGHNLGSYWEVERGSRRAVRPPSKYSCAKSQETVEQSSRITAGKVRSARKKVKTHLYPHKMGRNVRKFALTPNYRVKVVASSRLLRSLSGPPLNPTKKWIHFTWDGIGNVEPRCTRVWDPETQQWHSPGSSSQGVSKEEDDDLAKYLCGFDEEATTYDELDSLIDLDPSSLLKFDP